MSYLNKILLFFSCSAACFVHAFAGTILLAVVIGNLLSDPLVDSFDFFFFLVAYPCALIFAWYSGLDPYDGDPSETPNAILCVGCGIMMVYAGVNGYAINGLAMHYWAVGVLAVGIYTGFRDWTLSVARNT